MINIHLKYHQQKGWTAKLKTNEPFGSTLWPDLLRYRTFAVDKDNYGCMSGALHIRPQDACNF